MPWQLAITIHSLLSGIRVLQTKRLGQYKTDHSLYALSASFTVVFAVGIVYALSDSTPVDHTAAFNAWGFLLLGGSFFAALNLLHLKLFRLLPLSIAVIMSTLNIVAVTLIATIGAGERLTGGQLGGAGLLMAAVLLTERIEIKESNKKQTLAFFIGLGISVVIAVLFGTAIVNEKYLIDRLGLGTYVVYGWGLQAVAALTISYLLKGKKKRTKLSPKLHRDVWIYAALLAISGLFFVLSLVDSDSSALSTISSSFKIIVAMILGFIFLGERSHVRTKIVSIALVVAGLYLLFSY